MSLLTLALLEYDRVLGKHLLELGEIKANDIVENAVHGLLEFMKTTLVARLGHADKLDDSLQIKLLADPKEFIYTGLPLFIILECRLLRRLRVSSALAFEATLSVLHQLLQLLGSDLVVSTR